MPSGFHNKKKILLNFSLIKILPFIVILLAFYNQVKGLESVIDSLQKSFTIKGDWFMAAQWLVPNQDNNAFRLKRGYLTVENQFNQTFSARYTQDITIDDEGDDAGNVELRFKYCYLKVQIPALSFFTHAFVEIGLVHRPWIDFEEHINDYRVQSEMFLERSKVINAADFGLTYVTLLGGKMNQGYIESVSSSCPGKYGSIAMGIYNGGGYHAIEANNNKTIEGRFTLRPFPDEIPGLQFSYNMAFGKGNDTSKTNFRVHSFYISWESRYITLAAQYYTGKGNMSGTSQVKNSGYSLFGEFVVPRTKFMLFSRYDFFHPETNDDSRIIVGGAGYRFYKQNKILFDFDWYQKATVMRTYEIALEIIF
jgi:hypothetical protein